MYDKIIVPTDGTAKSVPAVSVAGALAERFGCGLTLTSLCFDASHKDSRHAELRGLADRSGAPDASISLVVGHDITTFLIDWTRHFNGLVVMSAGRRAHALPGSVTADVLRYAGSPMLMVGPRLDPDWRADPDTIVCPLDGSDDAASVLPVAADWAEVLHARLELVQSVRDGSARDADAVYSAAEAYLETTARSIGRPELAVGRKTLEGKDPSDALLDHLGSLRHPIIAMTSFGASQRVAFGSTTMHMLHSSPVPVLVARPPRLPRLLIPE